VKKLSISLDAHKVSNVIGLAFNDMKEPIIYGKVSADLNRTVDAIRKILKKYDLNKEDVKICYEAGPTGFVLARRLIQLGFDCMVIAPSKTPESAAGKKKKTDRRDARKLAGFLRSGHLTAVHIPEVDDEVIRDVCRGRTDASQELGRTKKQLKSFLLRNGYHYKGKANWSAAHMRYLRELVMAHPSQKLILEEYIQRIDALEEQIKRIEEQMAKLLETWQRKPLVEGLMGFRGFKLVAAMVTVSEIGYFGRFKHPKQLMAYLGLVPSEESSGETRRMGSITKCGNSHARWMLVECAGHYRMPPKISKALSTRQEGLPRDVLSVSWRAQNRLSKRWFKLGFNRLHFNKIRTAVARELVSFIWELGMLIEQQQDPCASNTVEA
jgi:transposase